jgi:hypothetical protein
VIAVETLRAGRPLVLVVGLAAAWIAVLTLLVAFRLWLLAGRTVESGTTWGCGYAQPTARMQYTSSSFARPLVELFSRLLGTQRALEPPEGLFPARASLSTKTPDLYREALYRPAFRGIGWVFLRLHWLQHGKVQLYVLYIAVTILLLLVWKLG